MKKIIKENRFNGDTYTLKCEKNGVKYFDDTALAFMTMLAMTGDRYNPNIYEEKKQRKINPKKKIIPKGLSEFIYGDTVIYALNKKNADRKALKQGLTTKNQNK
jgi:hypothetical protein